MKIIRNIIKTLRILPIILPMILIVLLLLFVVGVAVISSCNMLQDLFTGTLTTDNLRLYADNVTVSMIVMCGIYFIWKA